MRGHPTHKINKAADKSVRAPINMTERTKTGLQIIQAAAAIGVLGNVLLRQTPWGLNAFLFVTAWVAGLVLLWRWHRPEMLNKTNVALASAMVFLASMFLIRDAEELLVFDTLAIIVLMGVLMLGSFDIKAHIGGAFHYIAGVIGAGLNSVFGGFLLLGADIDWKTMPGGKISRNVFAVLRGVAIALPLLLIFGGLFMAADAVFEGWVNRAINFDIDVVISHVMITSALAWLTAGYFRAAVLQGTWTAATPGNAGSPWNAGSQPASVSSPHGSKGTAGDPAPRSNADNAANHAETRPPADQSASYVANIAAEQTEPENALPNNASILEHINKSDPPHANHADAKKGSPTSESGAPAAASASGVDVGGVDAASADGVVLSGETKEPAGETPTAPVKRDWQNLDSSKLPSVFTLGTVETVIILGLVNLLFAGFVAAQLPYLFGGMDLVQNTPGLGLADYARRGFGELVFVAALVLPMLLVSHWLVRRDGTRALGIYRILAGLQIALLFVIMASAVQRLLLLTGEFGYGLTTVRFYPMVFMIWLAVVFSWFAVTVLVRNARSRFAWGALWAAVVTLGATNLMNPHAFIASTNIQLMQQGREFDVFYNGSLSNDAVQTLINGLPSMSLEDQCQIKSDLHYRYRQLGQLTDLRSLNYPRRNAWSLLRANDSLMHRSEGCPDYLKNDKPASTEID